MKLISVTSAEYKEGFKIFLKFDDGSSGIVDLEKYIDGEIFEPLKEVEYFKNFFVDTWTIGWENGADFAPEFLYDLICNKENAS